MFAPIESAMGALLLHFATIALLFDAGAILGASGLIRQLFRDPKNAFASTTGWFFLGTALATLLVRVFAPDLLPNYPTFDLDREDVLRTVLTGQLTGWGTKHCGGCTSGHGLCGIGRLSPRSILATAIFFPVAVITFQLSNPSLETAACGVNTICYEPTFPSQVTLFKLGAIFLLVLGAYMVPISRQVNMAANKTFLISGLAFGLGLYVTGMANPAKVQASFAINFSTWSFSLWDPSLGLVMVLAVISNIVRIRLRGLEKAPKYATRFDLPEGVFRDVDSSFVFGATAFGIAWGLTGVCPGPAILRSFVQPSWGLFWMTGFWMGSREVRDTRALFDGKEATRRTAFLR